MKKSLILSIAAVAAVTVLSCQKENAQISFEVTPEIETNKEVTPNPNFVPTQAMAFVGTTDSEADLGTKTSIEGTSVKWARHEGIYLFDGVAPRAFTSDNDDVASTVNFEGNASPVDKYYAIYPSGKISTVESKKVIATTIPTFQAATANSFAPKANVAVAYSETDPTGDAALQFKNIAAVVKFKINAENTDVRKVRLDAINGEDMTGAMNVTFNSDGTFSTASVHANSKSCVILESESDSDLDPAQTYYMAIKPGTYAGGFKITLIREDGSFRSFNNTTSNTLERNDLVNLGELPKIPSWKAPVVDVLTSALINQSGYGSWTGKTATSSAVYSGYSTTGTGTNANTIQVRESDSGIVTTTSGGKARKVIVDWGSGTSTPRSLQVYGKNTAYSGNADLLSDDEDVTGDLLGTIAKGTSTECSIVGDYEYIGLKPVGGAMYLNKISIEWGDSAPADPDIAEQTTSITDLSTPNVPLTSGSATFTVASNGPWTIASNRSYATVSVSETDVVTVTFENLDSGQRDAIITVTPAEGAPKSVKITQKDAPATKTVTYTVASTSSVDTDGDAPAESSASFVNTYTQNKFQISNGNSQTLTLSGFDGKVITGVILSMHSNANNGSGTFSLVAGTTSLAAISTGTGFNSWFDNTSFGTDWRDVTVTMTNDSYTVAEDENVVLVIASTNKSLYCQSFTIQYQ